MLFRLPPRDSRNNYTSSTIEREQLIDHTDPSVHNTTQLAAEMRAQAQRTDYGSIIPPSLRPICRAYALGHLTTTAPRLFGFLRRSIRRKDITLEDKLRLLSQIIKASAQINRFPTACAIIVGGATALPRLIRNVLQWLLNSLNNANGRNSTPLSPKVMSRLRHLCSFLSAWLAFNLLNRDPEWSRKRAMAMSLSQQSSAIPSSLNSTVQSIQNQSPNQHHIPSSPPTYAGKTTDFTLFALTRAISTLTLTIYTSTLSSAYHPSKTHPRLTSLSTQLIDPLTFSLSATVIMWSWFYCPERLPQSYNRWISTAADIDPSLIQALRLARQGQFVYGQDTGQGELLADLCHKVGKPSEYGDPAITIPVPCTLYHSGTGSSCEYHALTRFMRSWSFAMKLYLPLQIATHARSILRQVQPLSSATTQPLANLLAHLLRSSSTSSSFLATFIALFYYSVCLARTRLGPRLRPSISRQAWDSGLCVLAGCLTCGWSILLEHPSRRAEIAQFTAPRALATLLPRVYDQRHQWRERLVFASCVAVVMGAVVDGKAERVRGVLGRVLGGVAREA